MTLFKDMNPKDQGLFVITKMNEIFQKTERRADKLFRFVLFNEFNNMFKAGRTAQSLIRPKWYEFMRTLATHKQSMIDTIKGGYGI